MKTLNKKDFEDEEEDATKEIEKIEKVEVEIKRKRLKLKRRGRGQEIRDIPNGIYINRNTMIQLNRLVIKAGDELTVK